MLQVRRAQAEIAYRPKSGLQAALQAAAFSHTADRIGARVYSVSAIFGRPLMKALSFELEYTREVQRSHSDPVYLPDSSLQRNALSANLVLSRDRR
jgi:hypothetical protein